MCIRDSLHAGVERVVDDAAGLDVLELRADERAALAGLHMLELHDGAQLAVVLDAHAVLEIGGRDCHSLGSFRLLAPTAELLSSGAAARRYFAAIL